jgi:hypothetical protein
MEIRDSNYVDFLFASGKVSSLWVFSLSCVVEFFFFVCFDFLRMACDDNLLLELPAEDLSYAETRLLLRPSDAFSNIIAENHFFQLFRGNVQSCQPATKWVAVAVTLHSPRVWQKTTFTLLIGSQWQRLQTAIAFGAF